ncbi:Disease resistance RPP13-like protein 4 [Abeliophyllum distichum]|uniref:Disease resistance RPP13-like protein 4 n=1 Tax=Abeliophyllum distichum TaxID=126358 RepID=A0ABD1RUL9_9LAMI
MAYASLLSLTQTVEQMLHSDDQCQVLRQTEKQIGKALLEKVRFLLSFLEYHAQKNSETIRCVEGRIRVAAYEAEDIIESQIVSDSRNHCERRMEFRRHNENLQKVIQELDSISEQVVNMKDRNDVENLPPRNPFPSGSSKFGSSNNSDMVGLDDDLMQVKDRFTGPSSKLEIVSIVGMGGIVKTTFARNVNDPLIEYYFHTHEKLYKCVKGKRYLIVLDDMWDTKAWDEVQWLFPDDSNGSRIILTTRLADVAVYAGSSSAIHHLSCLSPEKSWNLLHQTVFGEECCPCELEEIGKEIAKNCKGLPLALVVIGGLLYKGKIGHMITGYYKIRKSELAKLWVAEGFIKPDRSKSLVAVAEKYVEDLFDRNMILAHERSHTGKIKICSIHDLIRNLCVRKAQEENFLHLFDRHVKNFPEGTYNQRRKLFSSGDLPSSTDTQKVNIDWLQIILEKYGDSWFTEVLNLKRFTIDGTVWEPTEGNFLQLKVLLLSETDLEHLKANVTNFPRLQHLAFSYCKKLVEIHSAIGDIPTLQVIELYVCSTSAVNSAEVNTRGTTRLGKRRPPD